MYRYGNPTVRRWAKKCKNGSIGIETEAASYGGIAKKTVYFAALTMLIAIICDLALWYALLNFDTTDVETLSRILIYLGIALIVAAVVMIICSIVIAIAPKTTKICGTVYSVIQGAFLGLIAAFVDIFIPFASIAALLGTAIMFVVCLLLNKSGVRVKSSVWRVIFAAALSFIVLELLVLALSYFTGLGSALFNWIQILSCLLCIVFACVTIMWDLQNVNYLVENGADKRYEWAVAFALVTSLVYLYIQMLELLLRLAALFSKSKSKK